MLKEFLKGVNLDYLASGEPKIDVETFLEKWKNGEAILLDVRTKEESRFVSLEAFGLNIPLSELPDRVSELPKDKLICTICPGKIRATLAFAFLIDCGFENVKILNGSPAELVDTLKPGFIKKKLL